MSTPTVQAEFPTKNIALLAGGTIAAGVVGSWAYNYFFVLTDQQEIAKALKTCHEAALLDNTLQTAYHNELATAPDYSFDHLKPYITTHAGKNLLVYFYIKNLDVQLRLIITSITNISTTKTTLWQRKMKLTLNNDISSDKLKNLLVKYDDAIAVVDAKYATLQQLHKDLLAIRTIVTTSTQYILEEQQARIALLEQRVSYHDHHHCYVDTWSPREREVHVYTPAPQQNVIINNNTSPRTEVEVRPTVVVREQTSTPSYTKVTQDRPATTCTAPAAPAAPQAPATTNNTPTMTYDADKWRDIMDPFTGY